MSANTSVICNGKKTFIICKRPYIMTVLEQTQTGKTIKRVYTSPEDISAADKMDLLFARVVDKFRQKSK
ncbi:MAG: hypothetical protein J6S80_04005 [Alphaproteobacteria bacterium]|nr:hypothetical protein [Alphaproteobacteria bacterium]